MRKTGEYKMKKIGIYIHIPFCDEIRASFILTPDTEISIEVNPGTVTYNKLKTYYNCGINRLSIGLQTSNDNLLKEIGRIHTFKDYLQTIEIAKGVGFNNINSDLIIGIPNQTIYDVEDSINTLIKLRILNLLMTKLKDICIGLQKEN